LFNPNINKFAYCSIIVELLPTGNLIKTINIDVLEGYELADDLIVTIKTVFSILYMLLVFLFAVLEARRLAYIGWHAYFVGHFWCFMDWILIMVSFASFGLYWYREKIRGELFTNLKAGHFVNFQYLSQQNDVFMTIVSIALFFGLFKFLKLFKISQSMEIISYSLSRAFGELFECLLLAFPAWFGFVCLFYGLYADKSSYMQNFLKVVETSFRVLARHFPGNTFYLDQVPLGAFVYVIYNAVMIYIFQRLALVILLDKFKTNKLHLKASAEDEMTLLDYFRTVVDEVKSYMRKDTRKEDEARTRFETQFVLVDHKLRKLVYNLSTPDQLDIVGKFQRFFITNENVSQVNEYVENEDDQYEYVMKYASRAESDRSSRTSVLPFDELYIATKGQTETDVSISDPVIFLKENNLNNPAKFTAKLTTPSVAKVETTEVVDLEHEIVPDLENIPYKKPVVEQIKPKSTERPMFGVVANIKNHTETIPSTGLIIDASVVEKLKFMNTAIKTIEVDKGEKFSDKNSIRLTNILLDQIRIKMEPRDMEKTNLSTVSKLLSERLVINVNSKQEIDAVPDRQSERGNRDDVVSTARASESENKQKATKVVNQRLFDENNRELYIYRRRINTSQSSARSKQVPFNKYF
jgi:hypothetical protein